MNTEQTSENIFTYIPASNESKTKSLNYKNCLCGYRRTRVENMFLYVYLVNVSEN